MGVRPCLDCGALTSTSRCRPCATGHDTHRRPPAHVRYPPEYGRNRAAALERDGYVCQVQLLGCTHAATTADHIVPRSRGGDHSLDNLRASCGHCNSTRGAGSTRNQAH